MKRFISMFLSICLAIGCLACLSGCGSSLKSSFVDSHFIDGLADGLEARWDLLDEHPEGPTSVDEIREYIQLELDEIEQYETAKFNDQRLRANALDYIDVLHQSYEHADYALSDDKYDLWQDYEKQRRKLLQLFMRDNHLALNAKHEDDLKEYVRRGETSSSQEAKVSALLNMLSQINYVEQVGDDKQQAEDRAKGIVRPAKYISDLTNTTDYTILKLTLDLRLVDKNGKVLENHGITLRDLKPGDQTKVSFVTDKPFAQVQNGINSYTLKN